MLTRAVALGACAVALGVFAQSAWAANTVVADDGFRPNPNGFSFANYDYTAGYQNLTPAEMQTLYGPRICANRTRKTVSAPAPAPRGPGGAREASNWAANLRSASTWTQGRASSGAGGTRAASSTAEAGVCTLTPPAQRWMQDGNASMDGDPNKPGGHCYGFSVLALALFKRQYPPFGPGPTFSYRIQGNQPLQRAIAYAWIHQGLPSVLAKRLRGTPDQVLKQLTTVLKSRGRETYTVAIFRQDGGGGHAVTPFAVINKGGGRYGVRVYDNNHPNRTREISFDTKANTWSYPAQVNPHGRPLFWKGTARAPGILLYPTTPGFRVQPCPFCQPGSAARAKGGASLDTVQLLGGRFGHAHLTIAENREQVGVVNGSIVNHFPGALVAPRLEFNDFNETAEPVYLVPSRRVTMTVDGGVLRHEDTESLSDVGHGQDVAVDNLKIGPGQKDVLSLNGGIGNLALRLAGGGSSGSPVLRIGGDSTASDFALTLKLVGPRPGSTVHVAVNPAKQLTTFYATGNSGTARYELSAVKVTPRETIDEGRDTVSLTGGEKATFSYAK